MTTYMKSVGFVFAGAIIGSFVRILFLTFETEYFPFMLLLVNILGCNYAGTIVQLWRTNKLSSHWFQFHVAGIAGGTTTFAGFVYELMGYGLQQEYVYIGFWLAATLLLCTAGFLLGLRLGKRLE